jgi:Cu(I)/Ag(I) efflux system membrane fusion protein
MRRILITAVVCVILGLAAGWLLFRPSTDKGASKERKILYYRDPMNPQNTSSTPKKAPDGMDFIPVYAEEEKPSGEKRIAYYKDPMHPWFTSDKPGKAPDCGMDMVPVYEGESDVKGIKIDPTVVQNIGVKMEEVKRRPLTRTIRTVGKVTYDETKLYNVNTKIMGWVEKLYVDYTGKVVRKGDPLLEIYSPELVNTQQEYLLALRYREQLQASSVEEARKGAEELVATAKRRLLYWDISPEEIQEIEKRGVPKKVMTIYSPADGIVMEKMVVNGQNITAGMTLYKIADLSDVWVIADVYQFELAWVKLNQDAEVELSYLPGKTLRGNITYIYPFLSEETKTVKVRIEVPNPAGEIVLKPDMYATVKIKSPQVVNAVAVPDQAIIRSGERNIIVVSLGGGYFDPREVKLGVMAEGYVQVLEGIKEGEKIVTSSQFLIDSESNLKAAIGLMSGHAGHDMSKPMEEAKPVIDEHKDHQKGDLKSGDRKKTRQVQKVVDPVCGMEITPEENRSYVYKGMKYYFCSDDDMEKFKKDPEKYVTQEHQH